MTKTKPKGVTPSLIGGTNGRPSAVTVERKSACYRCNDELLMGTVCIEIPKLGGAYTSKRRTCKECYQLILAKTAQDLEELKGL